MKRLVSSERMRQELFEAVGTSGDPLGEAARRGAQLILQSALEREVDDFLGRERYVRVPEGAVTGYRNGYEPRRVR
jgi:transposase-like protein